MKRQFLFLALGLVSLAAGACSNPAAPRYPQEKEEPGEPPEPDKQGFRMPAPSGVFWV